MPVEYPQVIMAIKQWMGNHKTTPSPSCQIDEKDAVRKSGGMDYLRAAISDGISFAVSAGLSFTTGGTEGVGKYLDSLPPAVKEPILALKDSFGKITGGLGSTTIGESFKSFSGTFINPIAESLEGFKAGLQLSSDNLDSLKTFYSQDPTISAALDSASVSFGSTVKTAMDAAKSWSDSITLGTGDYTITNAINDVNDSSSKFLENYVGITKAPALTDLVGIVAKQELITTMDSALIKEEEARAKDLTIPENFAAWEIARDEVFASAEAIQQEVDDNQAAIASMLQQQTVLDSIGQVASAHSQLTDPDQLALYESILHPNVKDTARQFSTLLSRPQTDSTPETITTPT
jgi:hypothetical protein